MVRAMLPHPFLTLAVALVWVLISNELSIATAVVGVAWGMVVAKLTQRYWPNRPRVIRPLLILEYLAVFAYDVLVSNVQVALLVLFRRASSIRSGLVTVPIELASAEAIAALAGTITLTPGTLSVDVSADRRSLYVHCLDTTDGVRVAAHIKRRYESRLRRIFE
jgi:multicomponent K+:H+ antiporter subunit E